jgi:hypothetical protein
MPKILRRCCGYQWTRPTRRAPSSRRSHDILSSSTSSGDGEDEKGSGGAVAMAVEAEQHTAEEVRFGQGDHC